MIEHLKRAPITEALLDIKVTLPEKTDVTYFSSFYEKVKDKYPQKKEQKSIKSAINLKSGSMQWLTPENKDIGYHFLTENTSAIVQVRLDGFTYNKLKPYEDWDSFKAEAFRLWQMYIEIAKPLSINRIALRYINRIELPLPFGDFKEYILTVPEIAPNLPQGLANFFMRLVVLDSKTESTAIITETMEDIQIKENVLPFILDLDVIKEKTFLPSDPIVWEKFEELHELKNRLFFESITEKAKELLR